MIEKIKHRLWHMFLWVDNYINHTFFEPIFEEQCSDFSHFIWKHTSRAYCNFVFDHIDWDIDRKCFK